MSDKKPPLLILLLLMPFGSIAAVLFTPALPELAKLLNLEQGRAQAMMTLFLFGYALGNLYHGPIAKRFGRKPDIYLGILITILGSILVLIAGSYQNFHLLLIGRFLSALGSSVGMKICFTMIADTHAAAEATKKISLATLAFAIAPGLSIALGGYLTTQFGWQSCFYALIGYSILLYGTTFFLPETAPHLDHNALKFEHIRKIYTKKLKNKHLVFASCIMACTAAMIYLFSTLAPFIAITEIGLRADVYGYLSFIPPIGLIGASYATHRLAHKNPINTIQMGAIVAFIAVFAMLILLIFFKETPLALFLPAAVAYFGMALAFNNASQYALHHVEDKSNGSAIMSFITMFGAAVVMFISQVVETPIHLEMPVMLFACSAILIFLPRLLRRLA